MTKAPQKSSKRKQNLYGKYLKNRAKLTKEEYKTYKSLFEATKQKSKKLYYCKVIEKYKTNAKKHGKLRKK